MIWFMPCARISAIGRARPVHARVRRLPDSWTAAVQTERRCSQNPPDTQEDHHRPEYLNVLAKPPYELPPALAWFQLQETNRKGALRALRELGGHELDYRGYTCGPEPSVEADNRVWTGCLVTVGRDGDAPIPLKLFGAILERDGRFAVLSYDNDF